jgi:ribose transport system substrate-binding protein
MFKKLSTLVLLGLLIVGATAFAKPRVYYYVAPLMGHPYVYDQHLGFKYAAIKFNCEIVRLGPDGWDTVAAAQAHEQALAKKPDGIIVCLWDPSMIPGIKKARAAGIPVIDIEAYIAGAEINTYIGLDNFQCGVDTAKELIRRAGTKGNMVMQGNWGASNTEAKLAGFMSYLNANSEWKVVTQVDDKANTEVSIEGAKSAFNNFKNLQGYVGIDSSSAPGIGAAMEELGIKPGSLTVITHDREDATLEYIAKGYIQASLINKTAMQAYLAIGMLEMWYTGGFADAPVSSNNKASGFEIMPQFMYTGAVMINKENVNYFMHNKMDKYPTKLYH